ncbi:28S ribosomal protein S16, mitochondrial [Lampris incognitus]|uniref:28S ribosomal protein S16, mitochondrial n=1 Tax=Lampris incognitus TaxID=2546036 RepID=UPI0024B592D2|nr:28S ribosomal protein S16, mitochondrial [Lampris incognitus]XP_056130585.1 28S ribosomal protein S16, mitochondrial [Lampris incognitus]XP_056130586.1 28S ribosomal protein S16, mitochondrial [Lampris incognitus]
MVHLSSLLLKKYHGGYVVIRLALAGHKQANRPFYRIVAAYNKRARDGKYIEQLGTYDPLPNIHNEKLVSFNYERIKYWIGCGAHTTNPVSKLLGLAGFFPLHPMTVTTAERRRALTTPTHTDPGAETDPGTKTTDPGAEGALQEATRQQEV